MIKLEEGDIVGTRSTLRTVKNVTEDFASYCLVYFNDGCRIPLYNIRNSPVYAVIKKGKTKAFSPYEVTKGLSRGSSKKVRELLSSMEKRVLEIPITERLKNPSVSDEVSSPLAWKGDFWNVDNGPSISVENKDARMDEYLKELYKTPLYKTTLEGWLKTGTITKTNEEESKKVEVTIEKKLLINGTNIYAASSTELLSLLRRLEAEARSLEEIETVSDYVDRTIANIDKAISKVVKELDKR